MLNQIVSAIIALYGLLVFTVPVQAEKCLYVSSYHIGYEWSDGIEKGIESVLQGIWAEADSCQLNLADIVAKLPRTKIAKCSEGARA